MFLTKIPGSFSVSNRPAKMKILEAGSSLNKEQRFPGVPREKKSPLHPVAYRKPLIHAT
jgi:hypothetical protein